MNKKLYSDIDCILQDVDNNSRDMTGLYNIINEEKNRKGQLVDEYGS